MRLLVIGSVLVLLAAPPALAGGINLAWGTGCWQDNPSSLLTFACDTNVGSASMTASFAVGYSTYTPYAEAKIDLQSDSALLPDWWQLQSPDGCRAGSLSGTLDFTTTSGGCSDLWQGHGQLTYSWATALSGSYPPVTAPSRARLVANARVLPEGSFVNLAAGVEYYAFRFSMDFAHSTGAGSCAGCATPVTIVFNDLWILGDHLTAPLSNACLRWQADGVTPCSATPARNPNWGQVKGLYR